MIGKNKIGYDLDKEGYITSCGYGANYSNHTDENTPFTNVMESFLWRILDGVWVSTITNYQYIIIPTDLIPLLVDSVGLVEVVLTGQEFTVYLSNIGLVQRDGTKKNVKTLPISFTPCTILDWEEGDESQLQAIINQFNALYNPPRKIDFPCKFDSLQDFETFKQNYSYI